MTLTEGQHGLTLAGKIDALTRAFGREAIQYASRADWVPTGPRFGYCDASGHWVMRDRVPPDIHYGDISSYPRENTRAYVDLGNVARGEDDFGQSSTLHRSNFRSFLRDYPDMFTPVSYTNVDSLGAYVGNLTEDVIDVLTGLVEQYPLYDESDMSELESEEIFESFDRYVRSDITCEIRESHRAAWESLLAPEQQESVFWGAVRHAGYYPEHDGFDVVWRYEEFMPELIDAIETASAVGYDTTFDHTEPAATFIRPWLF
jgi:hypothetical protein